MLRLVGSLMLLALLELTTGLARAQARPPSARAPSAVGPEALRSKVDQLRRSKTDGVLRLRWPNGNMQIEGRMADGRAVGRWRGWHKNGVKFFECVPTRGKGEEQWTFWDAQGRKTEVAIHKDGELHGPYTSFHPNGQKCLEGEYARGLRKGIWRSWRKDGSLNTVRGYKAGKYHGLTRYYYKNGRLQLRRRHVNGEPEGRVEAWWDNGVKYVDGFYVNGKRHGVTRHWHRNGQPSGVAFHEHGERIGWQTTWDAAGRVRTRGRFRNGKPRQGSVSLPKTKPDRWVTRYYLHGKEITKAEYEKALAAGKVPPLKVGKELDGIDLTPRPAPKVKGAEAFLHEP